MLKSYQFQILVQLFFTLAFVCMACGSARTEEPHPSAAPAQAVAGGADVSTFHHNVRPDYVPQSLREQWRIAKLESIMRVSSNAPGRVFFTTQREKERNETFSVLDTRDGYMVNGIALRTPSANMRQLPVPYERGIAFATSEFLQLLGDTAEYMQKKYPGTIMYLGNLNLQEGGDIPYSVSHNSGRDGDIAYYLNDENGSFAHPDHLKKINRRFVSRTDNGKYHFDIQKNAALIEYLITQKKVPVQYIFVAKHLRTALRKELAGREEPEELLARFDAIVAPLNSHDDHFHIRIYCSDDDICAGCLDKSVIHEWIEDPAPKREACIRKHGKTIHSKNAAPDEKAAALQRISLLGGASQNEKDIIRLLKDEHSDVRAAAAMASAGLGTSSGPLSQQFLVENDPSVLSIILDALARNDSDTTAGALCQYIDDVRNHIKPPDTNIVEKISQHIIRHPREIYARHIIGALNSDVPELKRNNTILAFEVVTNIYYKSSNILPVSTDDPGTVSADDAKIQFLTTWFENNQQKTRAQWVTAGFRDAGFNITTMQNRDIPALLDAVASHHRAISVNAQLILKSLAHLPQDSISWSQSDALWHYTRYFKRRAKKYKIDLSDRDERGNKL